MVEQRRHWTQLPRSKDNTDLDAGEDTTLSQPSVQKRAAEPGIFPLAGHFFGLGITSQSFSFQMQLFPLPHPVLCSSPLHPCWKGRSPIPNPTVDKDPGHTDFGSEQCLGSDSGEHGQCGEECLCKWSKNIRAERESGIFWVKRSCGSCRAGVLASQRLMLWWL